MNKNKLQASARELRRVLDKYAVIDSAAALLSAQLQDLLERAERFSILQAVDIGDIPGYKLLSEAGLQGYDDLSEAYPARDGRIADAKARLETRLRLLAMPRIHNPSLGTSA